MTHDICPASDLITQGFGCTDFTSEWIAAWCHSGRYHSGIDLGIISGSLFRKPVYATRAGTVVAVGASGDVDWGFWNYLGPQAVCLKTHDAYILYAHLDQASVGVGQSVQAGQQVGLVGTRGNSTGPHLHVEVRTDGARQNVWQQAGAVLDPTAYLDYLPGATAATEIITGGFDVLPEGLKIGLARVAIRSAYYRDPTAQEQTDFKNALAEDGSNFNGLMDQYVARGAKAPELIPLSPGALRTDVDALKKPAAAATHKHETGPPL